MKVLVGKSLCIGLVLFAWWAVTIGELIPPEILANPISVASVLFGISENGGAVWENFFGTLLRALAGCGISVVIGTAMAMVIGKEALFVRSIEPLVEFIRGIPPVTLLPLFLVVLHYSVYSYITTVVVGCVPVVFLAVANSVSNFGSEKKQLLDLHRVRIPTRLFIYFMEILPSIFLSTRIVLALSIIITVVSEMVVAPRVDHAMGPEIRYAIMRFETDVYFSYIVLLGSFGYLANAVLAHLERRVGGTP